MVAKGQFEGLKKDKRIFPLLFLICYGIFLTKEVLFTTMIQNKLPFVVTYSIETLCMLATVVLIAKILLNGAYKLRDLLGCLIIFVIMFISYRFSGYAFIIELMWLLVASKSVSFDKILKVYIGVTASILLIAFIASRFGIIENLVYYQGNSRIRQSFGSVYPTDFSAHICYLLLAYVALRKEKITYWEIGGFAIIAGGLYYFCDPKNSVICIGILALASIFVKLKHSFGKVEKILPYSMPVFAVIMIIVTWFYSPNSSIMIKLNNLVNSRLMLGKAAYVNYGIKPFGQNIRMVGFGGTTKPQIGYNFIDSSYVMMFVRYGVALFLLMLLISVLAGIKAQKNKNVYVLLALVILSLHCIFEHHLLEISYNPFFFYLFAEDEMGKNKRKGEQGS